MTKNDVFGLTIGLTFGYVIGIFYYMFDVIATLS